MTVEVAVINKSAIALAADSAVTIMAQDSSGRKSHKIFNTANKLFTLSKYYPVGIMVYNTMELGGVQWEVIIKQFRRELGDKSYKTLEEYCDSFFKFLNNNTVLFPDNQQKAVLIRVLVRYFSSIEKKIFSNSDARRVFNKTIAELEKLDNAEDIPESITTEIESDYIKYIDAAAGVVFKKSYIRNVKRTYRKLAALILTKNKLLESYSGIVIAGFGEDEIFPSFREYHVDIVIKNTIKKVFHRSFTPEEFDSGKVITFAQEDMIRTMLEGINPGYAVKMIREAYAFFQGLPEIIISQISQLTTSQKDAYKKAAMPGVKKTMKQFFDMMDKERKNKHTFPIEEAISVMPFSELATVAEVFINLTQIRQRMSLEAETVGGPIDVAVISKGDGFVWIKRKQYFDKELNYSFLTNYFRHK